MKETEVLRLPPRHVQEDRTGSEIADRFSLVCGGPIYRFQVWLRMAMPNEHQVAKRAGLVILVTWAPLLLLSIAQGQAFGTRVQVPLLHDFAQNIRFLVAVPLLVVAEIIIDPRIRHAVRHFIASGLTPIDQLPAFEKVILKTTNLRDSFLPTLLIVLLAFAH